MNSLWHKEKHFGLQNNLCSSWPARERQWPNLLQSIINIFLFPDFFYCCMLYLFLCNCSVIPSCQFSHLFKFTAFILLSNKLQILIIYFYLYFVFIDVWKLLCSVAFYRQVCVLLNSWSNKSLSHMPEDVSKASLTSCCPVVSQHHSARAPWVCHLDLGMLRPSTSPPALVELSSSPFRARLRSLSLLHIPSNPTVCVSLCRSCRCRLTVSALIPVLKFWLTWAVVTLFDFRPLKKLFWSQE